MTRRSWLASLALVSAAIFAFNVRAYWFLTDDAFITFRYSDNLVRGLGLVFNEGERVEGYTNFSWALLMAAVMRLGLAPEVWANVLGIASGAGVLALLLVLPRVIGDASRMTLALPVLLVAANRSFTTWSTGGLETMAFGFLVFAGAVLYLRERAGPLPLGQPSAIVFALAALTRPEGNLFAALTWACFLLEVLRGARPARQLLRWTLIYAPPVLLHALWRRFYYGAWVPNTFKAKVNGLWLDSGLEYFGRLHADYLVYWFVPLFVLAGILVRKHHSLLFSAYVTSYCAYILAIGGGHFEFRLLVVLLPFFVFLVAQGLGVLLERASEQTTAYRLGLRGLALVVALGAAAVSMRTSPSLDPVLGGLGFEGRATGLGRYSEGRIEQGLFLRELIRRGELPEDLVIAVKGAGAVPYYTRWTTVDQHGLNDAYVASLPVTERTVLAHEHQAPIEYLREREVVMFDRLNRLVYASVPRQYRGGTVEYLGQELPLRIVRVGGAHLVFATFVSEERLRASFARAEVVQ